MKPNEMPQFSKLLTQVASIYSKPMNAMLIEIYWQSLKTFDFKLVEGAILSHIENPDVGQFMPKPADLIRTLKGSHQTQALQAWSLVLKAIKQIGSYSSVVFDDPFIHAVIADMGGWIQLCGFSEKEISFRAQEFEKRYSGYLLQPPKSHPKKLTGSIEQENSAKGFPVVSPIFIGNKDYALTVYQGGCESHLPCYQPQAPLEQLAKKLITPRDLTNPTEEIKHES